MGVTIAIAHHNARLAATLAFLNAGAGSAALRIYAGTRPATPDTAAGGTLLATIDLANPVGSINSGVLGLVAAGDGLIVATGVAAWARLFSADGGVALDLDCGDAASSADIMLASTQLYEGGFARLVSAEIW